MANARRGEIDAVFGETHYTLRLTLGALAELEAAFGAQDLVALAQRFQSGRLSARDLRCVIAAGLRGGGANLTHAQVAALPVEGGVAAYARIAADLLVAAFGDGAAGEGARPPEPQEA